MHTVVELFIASRKVSTANRAKEAYIKEALLCPVNIDPAGLMQVHRIAESSLQPEKAVVGLIGGEVQLPFGPLTLD